MKDGLARFDALKEKMAAFQFRFGEPMKSEKCTVLFPSRWADFVCGEDNAFLIGEAAGFISASSLEGISSPWIARRSSRLFCCWMRRRGTALTGRPPANCALNCMAKS